MPMAEPDDPGSGVGFEERASSGPALYITRCFSERREAWADLSLEIQEGRREAMKAA